MFYFLMAVNGNYISFFLVVALCLLSSIRSDFETDGIPIRIRYGETEIKRQLVLDDISILNRPQELLHVCSDICEGFHIFDASCSSDLCQYIQAYDRGSWSYTPSLSVDFMFKDSILNLTNADKTMWMNVPIGKGTYGQPEIKWISANFTSILPGLSIGRYCSIAPGVTFWLDWGVCQRRISTYPWHERSRAVYQGKSFTLRAFDARNDFCNERAPIAMAIGHDVWIAASAAILSGVKVGHGAVVGAFAVVYHDVAPYSIVTGNPAVHIGYRFEESVIEELLHIRWWDWSEDELDENMDVFHIDRDPEPFLERARQVMQRRKIQNASEVMTVTEVHESDDIARTNQDL